MTTTTLITKILLVLLLVSILLGEQVSKFGLLLLVIMTFGFTNVLHINCTEYTIQSDKVSEKGLRILFISDIHYGGAQPRQVIKEALTSLSHETFDYIFLGGDIFEECTRKEWVKELCVYLSKLNARHGIYYVYGNHDLQYETIAVPKYTEDFVVECLSNSGIEILKDTVVIKSTGNETVNIIGRDDKYNNRLDIDKLADSVDTNDFTICIDHVPSDFQRLAEVNVDLLLSGHTHAGQTKLIKLLFFKDDKVYGKYLDGNLTTIVSSGMGVGGIPYRTSEQCEYVIVNIKKYPDCEVVII